MDGLPKRGAPAAAAAEYHGQAAETPPGAWKCLHSGLFPVNIVDLDGEPHLLAKDICEGLGFMSTGDALQVHCNGTRRYAQRLTSAGEQTVRVLSVDDALALAAASGSPIRDEFERWVLRVVSKDLPPAEPAAASVSTAVSAVVPFSFDGAEVRVVMRDGEPWFVAKDAAKILGYADPTTAVKSHCRGVQKLHPIPDALGRMQNVRVLAESDLLRLVVGSHLPAAEKFERWVFEDVLPTIRKTGTNSIAPPAPAAPMTREQLIAQALLLADETIKEQAAKIEVMAPKAAARPGTTKEIFKRCLQFAP